MNILIIHAHTSNRGDEAAVKSMVDELLLKYPRANITISLTGITPYPNLPSQVMLIDRFPKVRARLEQFEFFIAIFTKGNFVFTKSGKEFLNAVENADLVIHAPGGPSIGDIYYKVEILYLLCLDFIRKKGKRYMFYAPSMGPFKITKRNNLRKKILLGAQKIIVRDPISLQYIKELIPDINVIQTLDSALQHDIDIVTNKNKYLQYHGLRNFVESHNMCIGITITDLQWHPLYKNKAIVKNIPIIFNEFIESKIKEGYGIIFIPQLYGAGNDTIVMKTYMKEKHTFMVDAFLDEYDAYFQQYLISILHAVVGMRYHSNIFSAKMGTPFISISYEQKMKGFMQSINMEDYCIELDDISLQLLDEKYMVLESNYEDYKSTLNNLHPKMKEDAYKSTQAVIDILEN